MTFNKTAMFEFSDKITVNYTKAEKNELIEFLELVCKYMTRKIKVKEFDDRLMFFSSKIKDAGFLIQSKMYDDQPTAKNRLDVELKQIAKFCDKCFGYGNFCTIGRHKINNKLYSICGLCQIEAKN